VFVAMIDTLQNLKGQVDSYYEKNALADIFAEVSGISSVQLDALEELPGIKKRPVVSRRTCGSWRMDRRRWRRCICSLRGTRKRREIP